ncbi:FAD-binding oxidoreductase [Agromyces sp. SYSU K20354]|uniref:FAD-binding oxidoreductase n=1 Tax=Agromyces cavernae TaxID=2898659 RepID=UPI001E43232E|nr:FAD-binding oxidoreductase [Agromyces cavernae]MCD2441180.1 FAD-binding oxidoreductase [Agromyces cavernae]
MTEITVTDIGALRSSFAGEILTSDDGRRYDEARAVFNAMFDRRPGAIARASCDGDVVAAILVAQSARMPMAVRAGGHSVAGYSTIDDGLLLDLRPMAKIELDASARTVRVGPGVTWGQLDAATQIHGLATTGGRMTTTGVAGFVLGSGSGWLERLHGWACDNLLSARLVTADGRVVTTSESENPELFWGLRGGGGNFGVVTEFELRVHPIGPMIYGGMLLYPREQAPELCRNLRDFSAELPREIAVGCVFLTAPPAPFVPPELHGRPAFAVFAAWFGDPAEGPDALSALREFRTPAVDLLAPIPYQQLQALTDAGNPPGRRNYWHSDLFSDLADETIDALVERANTATSPASVMIVARSGGAVADVPEDATPLSGRTAPWFYHCYGIWTEGEDAQHIGWVRETAASLRPWTVTGMPLNFFTDVDDDRVRSTFGEKKYQRLVALKDRYDPENFFRRNQNVRPSAG